MSFTPSRESTATALLVAVALLGATASANVLASAPAAAVANGCQQVVRAPATLSLSPTGVPVVAIRELTVGNQICEQALLPEPDPEPQTQPPICHGKPATIVRSFPEAEGEVIQGTPGDDVIVGGKGVDEVHALAGDDLICTGPGKDFVFGGPGDDRVMSGPNFDVVRGGPGSDSMRGGLTHDVMVGREGDNDICIGGRPRRDPSPLFDLCDIKTTESIDGAFAIGSIRFEHYE